MQAVNLHLSGLHGARNQRSRSEPYIGRLDSKVGTIDDRRVPVGAVLLQGSAVGDVQHLESSTDPQDRQFPDPGPSDQRHLEAITWRIGIMGVLLIEGAT